jgi:hypothetical protein
MVFSNDLLGATMSFQGFSNGLLARLGSASHPSSHIIIFLLCAACYRPCRPAPYPSTIHHHHLPSAPGCARPRPRPRPPAPARPAARLPARPPARPPAGFFTPAGLLGWAAVPRRGCRKSAASRARQAFSAVVHERCAGAGAGAGAAWLNVQRDVPARWRPRLAHNAHPHQLLRQQRGPGPRAPLPNRPVGLGHFRLFPDDLLAADRVFRLQQTLRLGLYLYNCGVNSSGALR